MKTKWEKTLHVSCLSFFLIMSCCATAITWEGHSWTDWYSNVHTATKWGESITHSTHLGGDNSVHTGWDNNMFPTPTDHAIIPSGFTVVGGGGATNQCGSLTIGELGTLNMGIETLQVFGPTVTLDGTIITSSYTTSNGGFDLYGDVTLTGSSPYTLHAGKIIGKDAVRQLTIDPNQTVQGFQYLGRSAWAQYPLTIINHGEIVFSSVSYPSVYGHTNCINNGVIRAEATGLDEPRFYGHWDNTNGTFLAEDGAVIELWVYDSDGDGTYDGSITGGIFDSEGTGQIRPSYSGGEYFVIEDIILNGLFHFAVYSSGAVKGDITVNPSGELLIGERSVVVDHGTMLLNADTNLCGTGETNLAYGGCIRNNTKQAGTKTLTIKPEHMLRSSENSYLGKTSSQAIQVVNNGSLIHDPIIAENNQRLLIHTTGTGFINNGLFAVNQGTDAAEGIEFREGNFTQNASGTLQVDGYFIYMVNDGVNNNLEIAHGTLTGSGRLQMFHGSRSVIIGSNAILDNGRGVSAVSIDNCTTTLTDGTTCVFRMGNGIANSFYAQTLSLGTSVNLIVEPFGLAAPSGQDYVIFNSSNTVTGSPTWNITLPSGWSCDGVEISGTQVILKNLSGTFHSCNLLDFAEFARTWQLDSSDANYNDIWDLADDDVIDLDDLIEFCNHWLQ